MPKTHVDYADYNITVYRDPCPYRCNYCWAWRVPLNAKRIMSGKYRAIDEVERLSRVHGKRVVVSFTSDPYPWKEAWIMRTRQVLHDLIVKSDNIVMVLTKNPSLALRDIDVMELASRNKSEVWVGTTITSADTYHPFSTTLEPYAPRTVLRLNALKMFQEKGIPVWVSIEPIIPVDHFDFYPETIVSKLLEFLDPENIKLIVLGRLNYIKQIKKYMPISLPNEERAIEFYHEHVPETIDLLRKHGINYHIKKELAKVIK